MNAGLSLGLKFSSLQVDDYESYSITNAENNEIKGNKEYKVFSENYTIFTDLDGTKRAMKTVDIFEYNYDTQKEEYKRNLTVVFSDVKENECGDIVPTGQWESRDYNNQKQEIE